MGNNYPHTYELTHTAEDIDMFHLNLEKSSISAFFPPLMSHMKHKEAHSLTCAGGRSCLKGGLSATEPNQKTTFINIWSTTPSLSGLTQNKSVKQ